jgi:hypothetical protein
MSRFLRTDGEPGYSELKPERCPMHAELDERAAKERRRIFMEELPLADELAGGALYDQSRRRSR